jgi:hypothetical protein
MIPDEGLLFDFACYGCAHLACPATLFLRIRQIVKSAVQIEQEICPRCSSCSPYRDKLDTHVTVLRILCWSPHNRTPTTTYLWSFEPFEWMETISLQRVSEYAKKFVGTKETTLEHHILHVHDDDVDF